MNRRIVRESLHNLAAGRASTVTVIGLACLVIGATFFVEAQSAESSRGEFEAFRSAGGYLFVIEPVSMSPPAVVPRLRLEPCERLNLLDNVVAAGSLGTGAEETLVNATDVALRLQGVSPGMYNVLRSIGLGPQVGTADLLAGAAHLNRMGVRSGSAVGIDTRGVHTIYEAPLESLAPGFGSVVMASQAPSGTGDACYVALEPKALDTASSLRSAFGRSDTILRRILAGAELAGSPLEDHAERSGRHLWLISAVLFAAVARYVLWARRSEIGLYRSLGLMPSDIRLLVFVELLSAAALGSLLGVISARIVIATTDYHNDSIVFGWLGAALTFVALIAASAAVSASIRVRNPLDALKDR